MQICLVQTKTYIAVEAELPWKCNLAKEKLLFAIQLLIMKINPKENYNINIEISKPGFSMDES